MDLADAAAAFGRLVVVGLGAGAAEVEEDSNRARDAAVGAVKREEMSAGLVTSRAFGFDDGEDALAAALSAVAARATEAAVGAARELRLGFLVGTC